MTDPIHIFTERGDLAHLALLLWAMSASALTWFALRELAAANRRFGDFVRKPARSTNSSETIDDQEDRAIFSFARNGRTTRSHREFLDHLGRASRGRDKSPVPKEVRTKC